MASSFTCSSDATSKCEAPIRLRPSSEARSISFVRRTRIEASNRREHRVQIDRAVRRGWNRRDRTFSRFRLEVSRERQDSVVPNSEFQILNSELRESLSPPGVHLEVGILLESVDGDERPALAEREARFRTAILAALPAFGDDGRDFVWRLAGAKRATQ